MSRSQSGVNTTVGITVGRHCGKKEMERDGERKSMGKMEICKVDIYIYRFIHLRNMA